MNNLENKTHNLWYSCLSFSCQSRFCLWFQLEFKFYLCQFLIFSNFSLKEATEEELLLSNLWSEVLRFQGWWLRRYGAGTAGAVEFESQRVCVWRSRMGCHRPDRMTAVTKEIERGETLPRGYTHTRTFYDMNVCVCVCYHVCIHVCFLSQGIAARRMWLFLVSIMYKQTYVTYISMHRPLQYVLKRSNSTVCVCAYMLSLCVCVCIAHIEFGLLH